MAKIAMIGAGSLVFCKTLAMDILATNASATSATPKPGRNTVAQAVPGAKIKEAERTEVRAEVKRGSPPKLVKLAKPKLLYEVEVVKNGKEIELMVAPDGAVVGKWQEDDDGDDDD